MWSFLVKRGKPCTHCQGEGKQKERIWKVGRGFVQGKKRRCRSCGGTGTMPR